MSIFCWFSRDVSPVDVEGVHNVFSEEELLNAIYGKPYSTVIPVCHDISREARIRLKSKALPCILEIRPSINDISLKVSIKNALAPCVFKENVHTSHDHIESRSFSIIDSRLCDRYRNLSEYAVIRRMVHASGDFEIADMIYFSPGAIERGIEAFKRNSKVIADVKMVVSGITSDAVCAIDDPLTIALHKSTGRTRASCAIDILSDSLSSSIIVIGNAPTALDRVIELCELKQIKPAVVIGCPVGFVGAAESKERLIESEIPCISLRGSRGGSAVAAAATNALYRLSKSSE